MTEEEADVLAVVLGCVETLNSHRRIDERLAPDPASIVLGEGGTLDSLGIVSLLVMVEESIEETRGVDLSLLDGLFDADGEERSWTIEDLSLYITNEVTSR